VQALQLFTNAINSHCGIFLVKTIIISIIGGGQGTTAAA